MTCCICFDAVEDSPFIGHPGSQHLFHTECIVGWIEANQTDQLTCPYCRLRLENVGQLAPFVTDVEMLADALCHSNNYVNIRSAYENWYFKERSKYRKLKIVL